MDFWEDRISGLQGMRVWYTGKGDRFVREVAAIRG